MVPVEVISKFTKTMICCAFGPPRADDTSAALYKRTEAPVEPDSLIVATLSEASFRQDFWYP